MTIDTEGYALLCKDSYNSHIKNTDVTIGKVKFRVLDELRNPVTGYQGAAYIREDTGELVIAHCGTDKDRMPVQDYATDVGMALTGVNAQTPDAMAFTKRALELGKIYDEKQGLPFNATVTGHSLGGTLAEITAARYNLHGETFNAYGAAGLVQGIPQGGSQVIDHARASDVVSAASKHFGEVRTYATKEDLAALDHAGYTNMPFLNALPTHAPILGKIQADAHSITNFVTDPTKETQSIINADDARRYQANRVEIDAYRSDIRHMRTVAAIPGEASIGTAVMTGVMMVHGTDVVGHAASQAYDYTEDRAIQGVHATEHAVQRAYDYTSGRVIQGAHAVEFGVHETVREAGRFGQLMGDQFLKDAQKAGKGIHDAADAVSHGAQSLRENSSAFVGRMLAAARSGDRAGFDGLTAQAAIGEPARAMHTQAVITVDRQEMIAAHQQQLAALQQQVTQQQATQQAVQVQQSPTLSR